MTYLLDPERDELRRICTPIVERVARELHGQYRRDVPDAPAWEEDCEKANALRMHWTRMAWQAVTGSIANAKWPSLHEWA